MKKLLLGLLLLFASLTMAAQDDYHDGTASNLQGVMVSNMDSVVIFIFNDVSGNKYVIPGMGASWRNNDFINISLNNSMSEDVMFYIQGDVYYRFYKPENLSGNGDD